jgi:hypothetical protein
MQVSQLTPTGRLIAQALNANANRPMSSLDLALTTGATPERCSMTPVPRPYCNWEAVHRVLATAQWMHADGLCTPTAMMAMTVIARHLNATTGVALASYETFWDEGGIPRSTVKRTLKRLIQAGYLEHSPDTYSYKLGPKVQTFTEEKSTAKKPGTQQAADPPATGRMRVKFDIK